MHRSKAACVTSTRSWFAPLHEKRNASPTRASRTVGGPRRNSHEMGVSMPVVLVVVAVVVVAVVAVVVVDVVVVVVVVVVVAVILEVVLIVVDVVE